MSKYYSRRSWIFKIYIINIEFDNTGSALAAEQVQVSLQPRWVVTCAHESEAAAWGECMRSQ
jgi:hypothetical protein